MEKLVASAAEAVADIASGMTLTVGGFGLCGIPAGKTASEVSFPGCFRLLVTKPLVTSRVRSLDAGPSGTRPPPVLPVHAGLAGARRAAVGHASPTDAVSPHPATGSARSGLCPG